MIPRFLGSSRGISTRWSYSCPAESEKRAGTSEFGDTGSTSPQLLLWIVHGHVLIPLNNQVPRLVQTQNESLPPYLVHRLLNGQNFGCLAVPQLQVVTRLQVPRCLTCWLVDVVPLPSFEVLPSSQPPLTNRTRSFRLRTQRSARPRHANRALIRLLLFLLFRRPAGRSTSPEQPYWYWRP